MTTRAKIEDECMQAKEERNNRWDVMGCVVAAVVFTIYVQTLYPSIAGGDSGELVAESCHLGVSHPPGYPLFNMIVYLVVHYLPGPQSKAWKANLFSAGISI